MNGTNDNESYSAHPGGTNFPNRTAECIRVAIRNTTFAALVTKAAGGMPLASAGGRASKSSGPVTGAGGGLVLGPRPAFTGRRPAGVI